MKHVAPHFYLLLLLALGALLIDLCMFFVMEQQITALALLLFTCQLFPLATPLRVTILCFVLCLQSFIFFSAPLAPLGYLLPSLLIAQYANGKLYENRLLPASIFTACLATHTWLLQPYMFSFTDRLLCTFSINFSIIGVAWIVSLTLRRQGGRGNRPRP